MGARLKVLLNCYACAPYLGSEPGAGWQFMKLAAQTHEVHEITEKDEFEANITRYLREHPGELENVTFHYIRRTHRNTPAVSIRQGTGTLNAHTPYGQQA